LLLAACDERRQETSEVDPDIELMNDIGQAGTEFERRLVSSVSVQNGLIHRPCYVIGRHVHSPRELPVGH